VIREGGTVQRISISNHGVLKTGWKRIGGQVLNTVLDVFGGLWGGHQPADGDNLRAGDMTSH
jgi:hypothetical protein